MSEVNNLDEYEKRTHFKKWDEKSWVRSKHRRIAPFVEQDYFFSTEQSPMFLHPDVKRASEQTQRALLVHQLYIYLEFTVWLEFGPVNEVCRQLQLADFLEWLPAQMKLDVCKIYCDEAAHAEFSVEMIATVSRWTQIKPLKSKPMFLAVLADLTAKEEPQYAELIKLFFVIISETLITGTLVKLTKDHSVQKSIRHIIRDHAEDEVTHHAYFTALFEYIWPRLPRALQAFIGQLLPEMILAFLRPDTSAMSEVFQLFPEFERPVTMANEIANSKALQKKLVKAAKPTINMLQRNGVLDHQDTAMRFERFGLL